MTSMVGSPVWWRKHRVLVWWRKYQVDVPEGTSGPWSVERFTVEGGEAELDALRFAIHGIMHRRAPAGSYTRLVRRGTVVMSDTPAEILDHLEAIREIEKASCERVLVNGLGLGLIVRAALRMPHVRQVDVVEAEEDVVKLIRFDDDRVRIHRADAYQIQWPVGTTWDVVWHDIWPAICSDNLPDMARLKKRYGRRARWQGAWCQEGCRALRDRRRP